MLYICIMIIYIYKLIDPITNLPRYIGKTGNLKNRLNNHLSSSKKRNNYLSNWIKSLLKQDLLPIIEIIEECSLENWEEREIYWIDYYKSNFENICNYQKGGGNHIRLHKKKPIKGYYIQNGYYRVRCSYNGTHYELGNFNTPEKAKEAYDNFYTNPIAAIEKLNQPKINKEFNINDLKKFKAVDVFDKKGNLLNSFISVAKCAKHYNLFATNIAACCRGVSKSYKGMVFKYKEGEN